MSVLAGEMSIAEAARKEKISEQSIGRWKADFLEAGKTALAAGRSGLSTREQQLEAEVADLTHALGRWQAKTRSGGQPKGPWPQPARNEARELILKHATKHSASGTARSGRWSDTTATWCRRRPCCGCCAMKG